MALNGYEIVIKAVGDPTRARIIKLLEGRELCVRDLMAILGLSQSTVSGHLSLLKEAGFVEGRKEGKWAFYSLAGRAENPYVPPMIALLMGWLDDDARVRADRRRLATLKRL